MAVIPAPSPAAGVDGSEAARDLVIEALGLQRRFRGGRGVGPLDLAVHRGRRIALMGPNGAGKTTLLRLLATLDSADSGTLRWWGTTSRLAARRGIGVALDTTVEEDTMSARQATHFWCRQWIGDRSRARRLTDAALQRFGLAAVADEPISAMSSGMRRRLTLAGALVHEPSLALLDEPTAGLDPPGLDTLAQELERRGRAGMTTVIASNDPTFVEATCDRVAFLAEGRLVCVAAPAELLRMARTARLAVLGVERPDELAPVVAGLHGVEAVARVDGALEVRFNGDAVLPRLVAVADSPPGRLRSLRARDPDLRDCFRALAGAPLEPER